MPYQLDSDQMRQLIAQPETGMGYQFVEATMNNFSSVKGVVLNADVFIPENKIEKVSGRLFLSYAAILKEAEHPGYIRKIRVIEKGSLHLGETKLFTKSTKAPAAEATISYSEKDKKFKRFSPYKNDHRIQSDGSLRAGSYATTEADAGNVKTGAEAVIRYALPSDDPAVYVFTIAPPEKTAIRVGIVEPANGKAGGGVEVIFENGSPANTVTGPSTIPAK